MTKYQEDICKVSIKTNYEKIAATLRNVFNIEKNKINGVVYRFDALVSNERQRFNSRVLLQLEQSFPEYVFHYLGNNRVYIIERIAINERGITLKQTDHEKEEHKHKTNTVRI